MADTISQHTSDSIQELDPAAGTGNWKAYTLPVERIYAAAEQWKRRVEGVEKPWLCWNVSPRWSVLQQKLVRHVGWTPVVGFNPSYGPPPVIPEAILIDFNESFGFPTMWPHFPLEFMFRWAPRLAFWHSDLLCRFPVMEKLAAQFESLKPGEMAAVFDRGGLHNALNFKSHRYWELCGCTTAEASADQFQRGAGWWRCWDQHPSCTDPAERARRSTYSYDSGVAILYWEKKYGGSVADIGIRTVVEGHCSEILAKNYVEAPGHTSALRNLAWELDRNYSLDEVAKRLGIESLLD